jgi:hypothetical protein
MFTTQQQQQFIADYLRAHPDASVTEIAREADAAGNAISIEIITTTRRRIRMAESINVRRPLIDVEVVIDPNDPRVAALVQAIPDKSLCTNCGGPHWVSQCLKPFPQKEPLKPIPTLSEAQPAVVVEEKTMSTEEQPMAAKPAVSIPTAVRPGVPRVVVPPATAERVAESHLGAQKRKGMWIRRSYLNDLLEKDPGADPQALLAMVRARFGMGISVDYAYETCRIARQIHGYPDIPTQNRRSRDEMERDAEHDADEELPLEEELAEAARQLADTMRAQGLTQLSISIDGGKARWSYKIARSGEGEVTL